MMRAIQITPTRAPAEHDEGTFHSLLDLEHRRCMQSGQAFHLLLCRLSSPDGARFPMDESLKSTMVSAMRESLGKTAQMGWFLQDLVLGALLSTVEARLSAVPNSRERNRVQRHIESRIKHTHPSLIVQLYDFFDFPRVRGDVQVRTLAISC
jgi:hypothetical protein